MVACATAAMAVRLGVAEGNGVAEGGGNVGGTGVAGAAVGVVASMFTGVLAVSVAITAVCTWFCKAAAVAVKAGVGVAVALGVGDCANVIGVVGGGCVHRATSCVPTKKATIATTSVPIMANVVRLSSIASPVLAFYKTRDRTLELTDVSGLRSLIAGHPNNNLAY